MSESYYKYKYKGENLGLWSVIQTEEISNVWILGRAPILRVYSGPVGTKTLNERACQIRAGGNTFMGQILPCHYFYGLLEISPLPTWAAIKDGHVALCIKMAIFIVGSWP